MATVDATGGEGGTTDCVACQVYFLPCCFARIDSFCFCIISSLGSAALHMHCLFVRSGACAALVHGVGGVRRSCGGTNAQLRARWNAPANTSNEFFPSRHTRGGSGKRSREVWVIAGLCDVGLGCEIGARWRPRIWSQPNLLPLPLGPSHGPTPT